MLLKQWWLKQESRHFSDERFKELDELYNKEMHYDDNNIETLDLDKLKNICAFEFTDLGAMGKGGMFCLINDKGEHLLFSILKCTRENNKTILDYNKVFYFLKDNVPLFQEFCKMTNNGGRFGTQLVGKYGTYEDLCAGWFFGIANKYAKEFFDKLNDIINENKADYEYAPMGSKIASILDNDIAVAQQIVIKK